MQEKTLQNRLLLYAKRQNMLGFKVEAVGQRGFPDLLLVSPKGVCIFIEVKHPNKTGRLSVAQKTIIKKLERNLVHVHVIDDYETGVAAIRASIKTTNRLG